MPLILLLAACPRTEPVSPTLVAEHSTNATSQATGALRSGAWVDDRLPWSVRVPSGWEAIPGVEGRPPRVTLVHAETRARIEVSVRESGELGPPPRRGCTWKFQSTAGYRAVAGVNPLTAATCTPEDAADARVLGYFVTAADLAWDLEVVIPPGGLLEAKRQSDLVLATFRIRPGPRPE